MTALTRDQAQSTSQLARVKQGFVFLLLDYQATRLCKQDLSCQSFWAAHGCNAHGGSASTLLRASLESSRRETLLFANHCEPAPISKNILCAARHLMTRTVNTALVAPNPLDYLALSRTEILWLHAYSLGERDDMHSL